MRTFLGKKWVVSQEEPSKDLLSLSNNKLVAKILASRGVQSQEEAQYYIGNQKPPYTNPNHIPQLNAAIERIEKALKREENIVVFGDYDVDGTTSTALLVDVLKKLGGRVSFLIPNRFTDGYGLNSKAIVQIKSQRKANLLITCDCGITNIEEVKLAQSIGLDVIVTDHHSLPEILPPAVAVLNPKLLPEKHPLHWLPGVGVAYKLAEELLNRAGKNDQIKPLLDLVALGMIADLAPLRSENRLLVQDGLKVLAETSREGLKALLRECGYKSCEEGVGFAIAPRINAAGRLHDANEAVKLFLAEDVIEAQMLAKKLTSQNQSRQELCDEIFKKAIEKIDKDIDLNTAKAIMLSDPSWHHGVVGIVASRLVEKYHLPVFIGVEEGNVSVKGSARGINSIDLFEEMNKFSNLFDKFGGHKAAAGFSMKKDNWDQFKTLFQEELIKTLLSADFEPILNIDSEIEVEDINISSLEPIWNLAPFGMGYAKPIFVNKKPLRIKDIVPLGKNQDHTKLLLDLNGENVEAIQWRVPPHKFTEIPISEGIKLAFTPNKREFRGREYLQLEIKDWFAQNTSLNSVSKNTSIHDNSITKDSNLERGRHSFTPVLVDYRKAHEKLDELIKDEHLFFAEGESLKDILEQSKDVLCFHRISDLQDNYPSLVFWSLPLDIKVIDRVIEKCNPQKILVFGKNLIEEIDTKSFLRKLLTHIRSKKESQSSIIETSLTKLASSLESLEQTCFEGLQILHLSGILSFKIEGQRVNINLTNVPQKVQLDTSALQNQLLLEHKIKQRLLKDSVEKVLCQTI
ncbi:MAG: single-stranded-DNA-specific exonuclease RecJ [Candidatus Caenarcaniphilales bacterium]|nr:single-stranded-DNA-specific exonuclease RecJ [Candidatus Caenarcaniphilales bacterium]